MPRSSRDLAWQMRNALVQGDFHLLFQPEYDLRTSTMVGLEALVRWRHPELGELGPDEFIPVAEQSELILDLGRWVIDAAMAEFTRWCSTGPGAGLVLRVNVSTSQLVEPGLIATVGSALERHGLAPQRLCAEITESIPITDPAAVRDAVLQLQELGIDVAIDDLASGYSALGSLRLLPVDVVKLDRSLVAGVDRDERAAVILAAVVTMAHRLGAVVVAEGVENDEEVAALLALGCHRAQGHHLGRPMTSREIAELLGTVARRPRPYRSASVIAER